MDCEDAIAVRRGSACSRTGSKGAQVSLFVRLETRVLTDAKFIAAGPEASWLWVKGLLYAKEHLTDGFVPAAIIPLLAVGITQVEVRVQALLDAELWVSCEGGYTVGDDENWSRHQTTREEVEQTREGARSRQRAWRERQKRSETREAAGERQKVGRDKAVQGDVMEVCQQQEEMSRESNGVTEASDENGEMPLTEHIAHSTEEVKAYARPAPSERVLGSAEVERAYRAYPRHVGKGQALLAIRKAVQQLGTGEDWPKLSPPEALEFLCERATAFARSAAGRNGKFTPHPATWFQQGRYLDDEREWNRGGNAEIAQRGSDGGTTRGAAVGRVERSLGAWDRAAAQRRGVRDVGGAV